MLRLRNLERRRVLASFADGVALSLLAEAAAAASTPGEGEEPKVEIPKVKWINVAVEGEWTGHDAGEFKFDRKVFEGFIKNLHEHPKFKADDKTGEGVVPVIPYDYEHTSELDPTQGSIPQNGVGAPAWALDFQIRDGKDEAGNPRAELWAKTKLGPKIREQIANDEYRFVSIAFSLEAKDPKTSAEVGPKITSIAFTNHPFLRELEPIAANRRMAGDGGEYRLGWYEVAGSVEDGLKYTRQVLGLGPTAGSDEIKVEIGKLVALAADPVAAEKTNPGVKVGEMFADLRKIWGLTVTKTVDDIVAEIDKGLAQIAVSAAAASGTNAAISNAAAAAVIPPPAPTLSDPNPQGATMALSANLKNIVTLFRSKNLAGTRMLEADAEVDDMVEDAVEEGEKVKKSLADILASLGAANLDEALAQIPAIKAAAAEAAQLKSMLDEALAMNAEVDAAMSDADVAIAASSKQLPLEAVQSALSVQRENFIASEIKAVQDAAKAAKTLATPKALLDARKAGRRKFLTAYGVAPEGMEKLLKGIAASGGGNQLKLSTTVGAGGTTVPVGGQLLSDDGNKQGERVTIKLSNYEGRNLTQRLLSWASTQDEFKGLSREKLFSRISTIKTEAAAGKGRFVIDATEAA